MNLFHRAAALHTWPYQIRSKKAPLRDVSFSFSTLMESSRPVKLNQVFTGINIIDLEALGLFCKPIDTMANNPLEF